MTRNQWQREQALKMNDALTALKSLNDDTDPSDGEPIKFHGRPRNNKVI